LSRIGFALSESGRAGWRIVFTSPLRFTIEIDVPPPRYTRSSTRAIHLTACAQSIRCVSAALSLPTSHAHSCSSFRPTLQACTLPTEPRTPAEVTKQWAVRTSARQRMQRTAHLHYSPPHRLHNLPPLLPTTCHIRPACDRSAEQHNRFDGHAVRLPLEEQLRRHGLPGADVPRHVRRQDESAHLIACAHKGGYVFKQGGCSTQLLTEVRWAGGTHRQSTGCEPSRRRAGTDRGGSSRARLMDRHRSARKPNVCSARSWRSCYSRRRTCTLLRPALHHTWLNVSTLRIARTFPKPREA
jgi:hypothetical protein